MKYPKNEHIRSKDIYMDGWYTVEDQLEKDNICDKLDIAPIEEEIRETCLKTGWSYIMEAHRSKCYKTWSFRGY